MGRRKITIQPLTDERNRNVTFLKRKAGLMKKAWELSVLCQSDVSILIFSAAGKPYEFSSKDLDGEIDRYEDYEGLIERRRGEEFAAAAAAGEDSDDDDDEGFASNSRRNSVAMQPKKGTGKSLKGQETLKRRRQRRSGANGSGGGPRAFVEGILNGGVSPGDQIETGPTSPSIEEDRGEGSSHRAVSPPANAVEDVAEVQQPTMHYPFAAQPTLPQPLPYIPQHDYSQPTPAYSYQTPVQWDSNLLTKYAEFQLQQNHQRQQRALLERQRQQLIDMGVPVEDRSLLDQIFGGPSASSGEVKREHVQPHAAFEWPGAGGTSRVPSQVNGYGGAGGEFVWPGFGDDVKGKRREGDDGRGDEGKRARAG